MKTEVVVFGMAFVAIGTAVWKGIVPVAGDSSVVAIVLALIGGGIAAAGAAVR